MKAYHLGGTQTLRQEAGYSTQGVCVPLTSSILPQEHLSSSDGRHTLLYIHGQGHSDYPTHLFLKWSLRAEWLGQHLVSY